MIVRDAEAIGGERAKILDFGIAKAQGSTDSAESGAVKTRTGALMGTPRYMSPEQCRGAGEVTGKSDVYSLGVMLYEMVAGRPPMVGEGMGELIAMHLYLAPTPLLELDPTLPIDLTQLIHSMLAKNPDERPAMSEVVKHLEQLGANRSIPPPSGLPLSQPGVERSVPPSPSWPDVVAGMLATPTTLRAAAAQVPPVEKPASRRSVASIAVAAVGLLGLATVISLQLTRRAGPAPEAAGRVATERGVGSPAATPPAPPPKVRWRITSQPAGAQVVRASDGLLLGTTPWQTESSRGDEKEALLLKLTGFVEQRLELSHSADSDRQEQLQPLPRAPAAEPRTRGKRKASSPAGASRKSASEDLSDDELRIVK
jgi:serine/threonine-protein kinase